MNRLLVMFGLVFAMPAPIFAQASLTGTDSTRVFAPDSSLMAYVRPTPRDTIEGPMEAVQATELWIAQRNGTHARRLLVGRPGHGPTSMLADLHSLAFSVDARRVYFLSAAWVTSDALHVVDIQSAREHYVAPAGDFEVIRGGEYRGCLLVGQHRYFIAGGSYDWTWLTTGSGKDIGPLVDDEASDYGSRVTQWRSMFGVDSLPTGPRRLAAPAKQCL